MRKDLLKTEIPFRNGDMMAGGHHFRSTFLISTQRNEQTLKEALHSMLMSGALETEVHREKTDSQTDSGSRDSRCVREKAISCKCNSFLIPPNNLNPYVFVSVILKECAVM